MDAAALAAAADGLGSLLGAPGDSWLDIPVPHHQQQHQQQTQGGGGRAFSALFGGPSERTG
jgi:hypothetical protein